MIEVDENEMVIEQQVRYILTSHNLQGSNHFQFDMDCNCLNESVKNHDGLLIELPEIVCDQQEYLQELFGERLKELDSKVIVICNL